MTPSGHRPGTSAGTGTVAGTGTTPLPAGQRGPLLACAVVLAALAATAALVVPWAPLAQVGAVPVPTPAEAGFDPAAVALEDAFHRSLRPWTYGALAVAVLVPVLLALTPAGHGLVRLARRAVGGRALPAVPLVVVAVTGLTRLAALPLRVRAEQVLRDYGLSTQTWGSWTRDLLVGWAVEAGTASLLLLALLGLARRLGERWWVPGAVGTAGAVVAGSLVYPLAVEPLFLRFSPLPQGPLRERLLSLAEEGGVDADDVVVADASRRTATLNAYVSGLGGTSRVVVYDTLLERATADEVALVVAHEVGHAARADVLRGTALGAFAGAAGVCALGAVLSTRRARARWGGAADPRVVVPLLALAAVLPVVTAPASTLVSRRIEARADVAALELTGDPASFASMQRRLATANLSDLDPPWWVRALSGTHPTALERIGLARAWQGGGAAGGPGP